MAMLRLGPFSKLWQTPFERRWVAGKRRRSASMICANRTDSHALCEEVGPTRTCVSSCDDVIDSRVMPCHAFFNFWPAQGGFMSAIARKINVGIAAGVISAAATLSPVAVASADIAAAPISSLSSRIGAAQCEPTATTACAPVGLPSAAAVSGALPTPGGVVRSIFQNDLWWIGQANPNPPDRAEVLVFTPMSLVPGFLKPVYGWFTQNLNFEICVLGGSVKVGPYGTTTVSVGRGCN